MVLEQGAKLPFRENHRRQVRSRRHRCGSWAVIDKGHLTKELPWAETGGSSPVAEYVGLTFQYQMKADPGPTFVDHAVTGNVEGLFHPIEDSLEVLLTETIEKRDGAKPFELLLLGDQGFLHVGERSSGSYRSLQERASALASTGLGVDMVVVENHQERTVSPPSREPRVRIAAVLAVGIFMVIGMLTDSSPDRNEPWESDQGRRLIETWVDTYNAGHIDGLLALYTDHAVINGTLLSLDQDYIRDIHSMNMSWNERLSVNGCEEVDIAAFRCRYTRTNDMLARAGLSASGIIEFGMDPSGLIRRSDLTAVDPEATAFVGAFSNWVESTHPEVALTTRFGEVLIEDEPWQVLTLVDEFVEQVWPLPQRAEAGRAFSMNPRIQSASRDPSGCSARDAKPASTVSSGMTWPRRDCMRAFE